MKRLMTFWMAALVLSTLFTARANAASIAWQTSLDAATRQAKTAHKPIFIYFWATWCEPCKKMTSGAYASSKVIAESRKWVMVKLDFDKNEKLAEKYKVGDTLPTMIFLKPIGQSVGKLVGYQDSAHLLKAMRASYPKARK